MKRSISAAPCWSSCSGAPGLEVGRFQQRATAVRDIGVNRAVVGTTFFVVIGLLSAVGTALVYGLGGYLVIRQVFTIGTIVAFGSYLTSLYGALQGLANAPVEFATSVVSFERVFEVIDLPAEIEDGPQPVELKDVRGELVFEQVSFRYDPKIPVAAQRSRTSWANVQYHHRAFRGAPAAKAGNGRDHPPGKRAENARF